MIKNNHGELILQELDLIDMIMEGHDLGNLHDALIDNEVDLKALQTLDMPSSIKTWRSYRPSNDTLQEFDQRNQSHWHMPQHYRDLDIAEHVLSLCQGQEELQRAAQELMMFQERGLFDLLKYLVYLVAVMRENNIVWGVGRGSSVASFVLYKLGVHRINSLYYDLDPAQFLR
jgi:DNA polymerase III alpha subunit